MQAIDPALNAADRARLGSDHQGERDAAALARPSSRQLDILKAITEQVLAGNAP